MEIIQQYLEPKLLGEVWLDVLAGSKRPGVEFDIPPDGASGEVKEPIAPTPIGQAALRRDGADVALISIGVGVHRALEAAERLAGAGVEAAVLDLRSVAPLDRAAILDLAERVRKVVVVDEETIPFARDREERALPNVDRIIAAAERCLDIQEVQR